MLAEGISTRRGRSGTLLHRDAVNEKLGLNWADGTGDWPDGLMSHAGGTLSDGFIVYEVWENLRVVRLLSLG